MKDYYGQVRDTIYRHVLRQVSGRVDLASDNPVLDLVYLQVEDFVDSRVRSRVFRQVYHQFKNPRELT